MQQTITNPARRIATVTLLVGFLGFQIGSLLKPADQYEGSPLSCEAATAAQSLACVSPGDSDASPLPPQG
ncbi:hypothetical protein [Pseudomonas aeruginosa]|uniref:hypothetical protein n=1 Tax=Pseudomonas aeruginosa TaxID=287 RepID=UPI003D07B25E